MASLKEFLAVETDKLRGEQLDARGKRDEWIASVQCLLDQMKEWLGEADTEGILSIDVSPLRLSEQGLGTYEAPALSIGL